MESATTIVRTKWNTLEHKGIAFPPEYQPRGISITICGERLMLNPDQEELVHAWAKKKDTHYVQDPVFQSNFLNDFKKLLPEKFQNINSIKEINFSEAYKLVEEEKKIKEAEIERIRILPSEEKRKLYSSKKAEREKLRSIYGKAIVDGIEVDIANWLVEPPGLFMGRGQHPLRGKWKPRIRPQDVSLNLGENAPVPEGTWQNIVHDHSSTWLATWMEKLTGKRKYVWLHDSSALRQNNDREKYEKAKKLERHIDKVQKEITNRMLKTRDINEKKIATVCYLIFKLAMRVGDEKDPEEADTVGASTLRVEHIKFPQNNNKQFIEFNFLGKDSVPWQKTVEVNSEDTRGLYNNLKLFMDGKQSGSHIFDGITSSKVNAFLRSIDPKNLPGLTGKVFRTYIATKTLKEALASPPIMVDNNSSETLKIYVAKTANLKAAITCNHKKGIDPKNPASKKALEKFEESMKSKKEAIERLKADIAAKRWKTKIQKKRLEERLEKIEIQLKLQKETRDYNLGTSLRNYIDPRVMKAWLTYVDLDWKKVYTATLRLKFRWVEDYSTREIKDFYPTQKEMAGEEMAVVQEES
ncbi:MAG TPA: DNA topoisomerase I [Nitrososphaeraceae archaeon]|nr:DNA topoisomerase I [Nitrososphaeraceae archaeon]